MTNTIQEQVNLQFAKMVAELADGFDYATDLMPGGNHNIGAIDTLVGNGLYKWMEVICAGKTLKELQEMVNELLEEDND